MITRMEIIYKSKEPTGNNYKIFSSGSYTAIKNDLEFTFDFESSEWASRHENGYLFIDVLQKNYDETVGLPRPEVDLLMRTLTKEDFIDINVECFVDEGELQRIELIPVEVTFYDYSTGSDGNPIKVNGKGFTGLNNV